MYLFRSHKLRNKRKIRVNEAEYNSGIQGAGVVYIAKSTILILLDRSTWNKKSTGDRYVT